MYGLELGVVIAEILGVVQALFKKGGYQYDGHVRC